MEEIIIIEELAKGFFSNNPNSDKLAINKGALGVKLGAGTTKTDSIAKGLEAEYPFIRNERGFITIDRKGFEEFEVLREEQRNHVSTIQEINAKYPQLAQSIEDYKEKILKNTKIIEDTEKEKAELESQANQIEQNIIGLQDSISQTQASIEGLNTEYDKLKEETEAKETELQDKKNELEQSIAKSKESIAKLEAEIQPINKEKIKLFDDFLKLNEDFERNKDRTSRFVKFYKRDKIRQIETLMKEVWKDWQGLVHDSEFHVYGT